MIRTRVVSVGLVTCKGHLPEDDLPVQVVLIIAPRRCIVAVACASKHHHVLSEEPEVSPIPQRPQCSLVPPPASLRCASLPSRWRSTILALGTENSSVEPLRKKETTVTDVIVDENAVVDFDAAQPQLGVGSGELVRQLAERARAQGCG